MKKMLICPGERAAVAFLSQSVPLVNLPVMGESLIGHWMEFLAGLGVKEVMLLATDRPEQVRELVDGGTRWGLRAEVISEMQELTPEEAYTNYRSNGGGGGIEKFGDVILVDHLPGFPTYPLFTSYAVWFSALQSFLLMTPKTNRIGIREIKPGVWVGLRCEIAASAELKAPCWIGESVRIGPDAVVGPRVILENRVVVERAAEIGQSLVGPETFIGTLTKVQDSLAWGNTLINWCTGSCTQVPDAFLMSHLGHGYFSDRTRSSEWFSEAWMSALVRPWSILNGLKAKLRQR